MSKKQKPVLSTTAAAASGTPVADLAKAAAAERRPAMLHIGGAPAAHSEPHPQHQPEQHAVAEQPDLVESESLAVSTRLERMFNSLHGAEQAAVNGVLVDLQMARFKAREAATSGIFNDEEVALLREIAEL